LEPLTPASAGFDDLSGFGEASFATADATVVAADGTQYGTRRGNPASAAGQATRRPARAPFTGTRSASILAPRHSMRTAPVSRCRERSPGRICAITRDLVGAARGCAP
jgi:hypothetical protein